ncbi:hypothetical protein, partial [Cognatilysobacter lacus]
MTPFRYLAPLLCAATTLLAGCASVPGVRPMEEFSVQRVTAHRDGDDLLTAGLGLTGLRGP